MTTLVAIADAGSFTRAAEMLNLPKSRISQRVAALEYELGVRLINRNTRKIKFTEAGMTYLDTCRAVLCQIESAEDTIKEVHVELSGTIRVDALVSVARHILAPRLNEFQVLYPKIRLRLSASDRFSNLLEEGIDCAIRGGVLSDSTAVAKQLAEVCFGLYASPYYLSTHKSIVEPDDLAAHRLLSWFSNSPNPFTWELENDNEVYEVKGQNSVLFDDPDVAIQACISGYGICPGAPFAVAGLVCEGKLVPVLPRWRFQPRPISIIYPSRHHITARTRAFINWLTEIISNEKSISMLPSELASTLEDIQYDS